MAVFPETRFATIQLASYTEAQWTTWNMVLLDGQHAFSRDILYSGTNQPMYKVGNGADVWTDLDYVPDAAMTFTAWGSITGTLIDQTDLTSYVSTQIAAATVGLWDDRGNFDASGGAYPSSGGSGTAGSINKGDIWTISVAGTLPTGQVVEIGDTVRALVNTPGNTQANWAIAQNNIGYTPEPAITGTGNTADFWSGAKTFRNLATDVRAVVLTGLNLATSQPIAATDTILLAFGYLQSQITAYAASFVKVDGTTPLTGNWAAGNFFISASKLGVGTGSTTPATPLHVVETSTSTPRGILADQYNSGTQGARVTMRKARGSFASPSIITTGDVLASWTAAGFDGVAFIDSAKILVTSIGTIATNIVPSKMDLQTMNAAGTLTTGITIDQSQIINIPNLTVSSIVETDASKNLISAAKATAYNKAFGTTATTVTEGNDSRLTNTRISKVLGYINTPASGTNTTSEELLTSNQIAASILSTNDIIEFVSSIQWSSTVGSKQFKLYINTSSSLSGATLIATGTINTTNTGSPFSRRFFVLSDTTIRSNVPAAGALNVSDATTSGTNVPTTITVPSLSAGFYFIISGQKVSLGTDTDTVDTAIYKHFRI